jgi:putative transposase
MSHSLTRIWIHGVFHTNNNFIIPEKYEEELLIHIKNQMENNLNCGVRIINSGFDHLHILFLLNPNISIKDVFQKIKGESAHWYNQTYTDGIKFSWQTGYGAFSISESHVGNLELYIQNQKEHHKTESFQEEFDSMLKKIQERTR